MSTIGIDSRSVSGPSATCGVTAEIAKNFAPTLRSAARGPDPHSPRDRPVVDDGCTHTEPADQPDVI
jgi:hypothetical protein